MNFSENELLELITAVADQKTYYRLAISDGRTNEHFITYYRHKLKANCELYDKLQAMLAAIETAGKL